MDGLLYGIFFVTFPGKEKRQNYWSLPNIKKWWKKKRKQKESLLLFVSYCFVWFNLFHIRLTSPDHTEISCLNWGNVNMLWWLFKFTDIRFIKLNEKCFVLRFPLVFRGWKAFTSGENSVRPKDHGKGEPKTNLWNWRYCFFISFNHNLNNSGTDAGLRLLVALSVTF